MNSSFYVFYKTILRKVSFDYDLFSKELIKAISCLPEKEALRLFQWSNKLKKPK